MLTHDQQIIEEIRQGRQQAFQEVFSAFYGALCRYAFTMLKDMDEAEDTVQSVFIKLWEKRETLEIRFALKSYLFKTVYHQCLNLLEHRVVKHKHRQHSEVELRNEADRSLAFARELEENVATIIETLPPQCRTVFMMSRYEELKHTEIADRLEISVNTVQNHISKALHILREQLRDNWS